MYRTCYIYFGIGKSLLIMIFYLEKQNEWLKRVLLLSFRKVMAAIYEKCQILFFKKKKRKKKSIISHQNNIRLHIFGDQAKNVTALLRGFHSSSIFSRYCTFSLQFTPVFRKFFNIKENVYSQEDCKRI